jgi:hypothetical protein
VVKAEILDQYVGVYQQDQLTLRLTRQGDRLVAQLGSWPQAPLYAVDERTFQAVSGDGRVTFDAPAGGHSARLLLRVGDADLPLVRTTEAEAVRRETMPREHIAISMDSATLGAVVGRYELSADNVLTVSRQGDRLYAAFPGQPPVELFRERSSHFFAKDQDLQVTFEFTNPTQVSRAVVHRDGADQAAPRIVDLAFSGLVSPKAASAPPPPPAPSAEVMDSTDSMVVTAERRARAEPMAVNVSGSWAFDGFIRVQGRQIAGAKPTCWLQQAGPRLTGTCKAPNSGGAATGTIDGRRVKVTWQASAFVFGGKAVSSFNGVLGSDGVIRGAMTSSTAPGATGAFTAWRFTP